MDQPERVRYFDQQFLRIDDFNAEQTYHRDMRRRHNRMLHTPGISEGLQLVPAGPSAPTAVKITPGAAVAPGADGNGGGAEIVLTTEFTQDLSSFADNSDVFITIAFAQEETRPVSDAGFTANSRWRETPKIEAFTSDPTLAAVPAGSTQPLRVLLGRVKRSLKIVAVIDGSGRRLAGAAESELTLTPRDPTIPEPDWVRLRWLARGQAELRGNLALVASQSTTSPAAGDLSVAGKATVSSDLTVSGKAGVTGELKVGAKLTVSGDLAVTGTTLSSGALTVGASAARQRLMVFGDAVVNRALILMGNTDGGVTTSGTVLGGLGFLGHGVQHGQLSFRAGSGFELVDRSVDSPTLDYPLDSRPYADLRIRNLFAAGTIRASTGSSSASGVSFVGSSAGEEAFVRYAYEAGDDATLVLGCGDDVNDRVELHQAGGRRLTVHSGNVGIGIRTPSARLDVGGDVAILGKHAFRGNDTWLRLNQDKAFVNGVHTPGNLTAVALNIGGRDGWDTFPGHGNAWISGRCFAGHAMIGDVGHPAWAGFCHEDAISPAKYALLQSSDGKTTLLNHASGGGKIEFRVDNSTRTWMDDAGNMRIWGNLGTHGFEPDPKIPGWGGGVHTWDVEAEGTVWSRGPVQTGPRDLAETFACDDALEAGDVVVLDGERDVVLRCRQANDAMVLGVVSERPGFLLGARPEGPHGQAFAAIALAGRVPCKVTTANGPIARGALLTASEETGRAMRADPVALGGEHVYRSGTIIGKALESCDAPSGTIEIVVMAR